MILLIAMMLFAPAAFADTGDDDVSQIAICGTNILDESGNVIESSLPTGVTFDPSSPTPTLTLTNCALDVTDTDATSFIQCNDGIDSNPGFTSLKIVLIGNNTFTGTNSTSNFTGIDVPGEIDIDGTGSLTMDFSERRGSITGINGKGNIQIANTSYSTGNVSLNIIGCDDSERPCSFIGINMHHYTGYAAEDGKQHQIIIQKAKLNISNATSNQTDHNAYENIGINSNDSDVIISDSIISLDLTGGEAYGIKCGLSRSTGSDTVAWGGKFSATDYYTNDGLSTRISIRLHDVGSEKSCAARFSEDGVDLPYKYVANPDDESNVEWIQGFYHQWQTMNSGWLEAQYRYLELSAEYIPQYAQDDPGESPGDDSFDDAIDPTMPVKLLGTNIVVSDGNEGYKAKTTNIPGVTGKIAYNIMTRTLTLDNCTFTGKNGNLSYIESEGPLKIFLKGTNTFKGAASAGTEDMLFGIHATDQLYISGSGSLSMDFRTFDGPVTGIQGDHIIEINGPTIKMIGASINSKGLADWSGSLPRRHGDFYGIRMDPSLNNFREKLCEFGTPDNYYDGPDFHIGIYNATINVFNSCSAADKSWNLARYSNVGVESGDTNLYVENSRIKLKMIGNMPKGMVAGYYYYTPIDGDAFYGGELSIDEKSWITIQLMDPCCSPDEVTSLQFDQEYYSDTYEYVPLSDYIKSPYIYAGNPIVNVGGEFVSWAWVLWNESLDGKLFDDYDELWSNYLIENAPGLGYRVCLHQGLELSPTKVEPGAADPNDPKPESLSSDESGSGGSSSGGSSSGGSKANGNTNTKTSTKVGTEVKVKSGTVKITSASQKTATFAKAANKKTVTVPDSIVLNGNTFTVTDLDKNAFKNTKATKVIIGKNVKRLQKNQFKGTKVKTLILKTKLLTKKSVKKSLKGSKVKTIKLKVGSKKNNKKYVAKYKKIFTKKNAGKKAAVK